MPGGKTPDPNLPEEKRSKTGCTFPGRLVQGGKKKELWLLEAGASKNVPCGDQRRVRGIQRGKR